MLTPSPNWPRRGRSSGTLQLGDGVIQIPKKAILEDRIRSYFAAGCKRAADRMVGVEWEKIGVYRESGLAIRYAGERGVEAIFERLPARFGWAPGRAGARPGGA